jgi:hypothetical protein
VPQATRSKTEITLYLLPKTRFPSVDIQLVRIKYCNWHRCIGSNDFVRRYIFWPQFEFAPFAVARFCQAINCQAQVRKNVVIDDIFKENRVRIERFLA